jgi:hypothetical protein
MTATTTMVCFRKILRSRDRGVSGFEPDNKRGERPEISVGPLQPDLLRQSSVAPPTDLVGVIRTRADPLSTHSTQLK